MDLVKLHNDSRALLERFADRLPADALATYRTFSEVGEWGELIDNVCASFVLDRIRMTSAERDSVAALLSTFPTPPDGYTYLGDPSRVLAGLNVVDEPRGAGRHHSQLHASLPEGTSAVSHASDRTETTMLPSRSQGTSRVEERMGEWPH